MKINPKHVRYIKLGAGNSWAAKSLSKGELHFGYDSIPHETCLAARWEDVERIFLNRGRSRGKARDQTREVRDFYALGADSLWITLADGHLWWAFAKPKVHWLGAGGCGRGARMRRVIGNWRKTDVNGKPLAINSLSTKLTQVGAYRQTICRVKAAEYLLRKINGIEEPIIVRAKEAHAALASVAEELIASLHWSDFETLIDLIFARTGWERISRVGEQQKDVDLILREAATGETAFVQVKSRASWEVLDDYVQRFKQSSLYDRMFFVCHSPRGRLPPARAANVHVWTGGQLAQVTVRAGLFEWLIEKAL